MNITVIKRICFWCADKLRFIACLPDGYMARRGPTRLGGPAKLPPPRHFLGFFFINWMMIKTPKPKPMASVVSFKTVILIE